MHRSRLALLAATACTALLQPVLAAADDTEVFFARARTSGDNAANVLFMFDISGSMDRYDGTPYRRITRVKQAMLDILESVEGVNVGIGAFNGVQQGGAILHPTKPLDTVVCDGAGCDSIAVRAAIAEPSDDAHELASGEVVLDGTDLEFTDDFDDSDVVWTSRYLGWSPSEDRWIGGDNAVQYGNGPIDTTPDTLPLFHAPTQPTPSIGLRFREIDVPAGVRVPHAYLTFRSSGDSAPGVLAARISADASIDVATGKGSPPFADAAGLRVQDRTRLPETMVWEDLWGRDYHNATVSTRNIASVVGARVTEPDWEAGDALTLLVESANDGLDLLENHRVFQAYGDTPPLLTIGYTSRTYAANTVGLRFSGVDVPRGATITRAVIEMLPSEDRSDGNGDTIVVRAEASDDAATFADTTGNVGLRATTAASVDWTPEPWLDDDDEQQTSDLSALVQEVVDRSGWCGGNALAFVMEGESLRAIRSRDSGVWNAPVLKVEYDPGSVDLNDTCTNRRVVSRVEGPRDDAGERLADGVVDAGGATLETSIDGQARRIGLRFRDVDIPQGASLTGARLKLKSAGAAEAATLEIRVEAADDALPFTAGAGADVSGRGAGAGSRSWDVPETVDGDTLVSVDIGDLVQNVVGRGGWSSGNALVVTLERDAGDERSFRAFDGGAVSAARLELGYRSVGSALEEATLPVRTTREELIDTVREFGPRNGTPLVDAYYEAALYLLGEEVDYGRRRGRQLHADRFYRTSAPSTFVGGELWTPPDCDTVNPNSTACVAEEITGAAMYDAPAPGACQANQIVLLSDGDASTGSPQDRIRQLVGTSSCEARPDNRREECAFELADWLYRPPSDETHESIVTHTVGFNFSSDFLRDLATRGGGRFAEAGSAGQLANVFRDIIDDAATPNTSFVAPAAAVNQFNRLSNRDDIYYAMFRPSLSARWDGNLKRYELNKLAGSDDVRPVDALGLPLLDADGAIRADAKSFWTDGAADGAEVAAGGAANELALPRNLLTYVGDHGPGTTLVALSEDTAAIDAAALGIDTGDAPYRRELLRWARGVDVLDVDGDGDVTEVRRQMGDPMHSTPIVLNYASSDPAGKSVVFVGTNEGFLHAIDTADGGELFGFIPSDLLPNLDRFYRDEIAGERPYGLDGPISAWFDDVNDNLVVDPGETAYVIVGMRRGGRNYYALDVSDPAAPTLAWVIRGGRGDAFDELGQSWSRATPTKLLVDGDVTDVLVFGAGYDPVADQRDERNRVSEADTMGRGLFVVEARSGDFVARLGAPEHAKMTYAIPSDVNVLDVDLDGLADMFWVGDMGGQLWRFDIVREAGVSSTSGAVVADFGSVGQRANRRFHYPPDIALLKGEDGGIFMNVAIGSGWRAHPLDDVVDDRFYVLRERSIFGPPRDDDGVIDYPLVGESDLFDVSAGSTLDDTGDRSETGWYLPLVRTGEKALARSLTVNGQILFTTYVPDLEETDECSASVGGGRLYALDALTGGPVLELDGQGTDTGLTLGDRSRALLAPGIPAAPTPFISARDLEKPSVEVGLESAGELDFGPSLRRTYWAEQ